MKPSTFLPRFVRRAWIDRQIKRKWDSDRKSCPLVEDHWEIYRNIHFGYWAYLRSFPNLIDPRSFNDKMQWLKLFDQDEKQVTCSDKLLFRDHVVQQLGQGYLPELYQVADTFSELDLDALPAKSVVKTNHDSGSVFLLSQPITRDEKDTLRQKFDASLQSIFHWEWGEWAYRFIEPRIFAEERLAPHDMSPPPDYKFYSIEGSLRFCHFIYDRANAPKEQVIDLDGKDMRQPLFPTFPYGDGFRKPENWDEMKRIAQAVGKGFKCVRVDLYNIDGRIVAGEMCMWPGSGFYPGEGQKTVGRLLDFDLASHKPPIAQSLLRREAPNNRLRAVSQA